MEYVQAGQIIRELRKRRGLSQEQLCEGLCEPPTMSKIEKGRQYPTKKLLDALFVRLQENVELQVPLSAADFERAQIEREVMSRVAGREYDVRELAERYKLCAPAMNKHEMQFYLFTQAVYLTGVAQDCGAALRKLEEAIRLTLPAYAAGAGITVNMLSSLEFTLLNNMAICLWTLGRKDEAVSLMEQLYAVLNSYDMDREEYSRRFPMVAFNLSTWLGIRKDYAAALEVAEKGIQCSIKYGKCASLGDLLYNKGFSLMCLGKEAEAEGVLRRAFMLMFACNSVQSYENLKNDLIESFGGSFWDAVRSTTLPDACGER